MTKEFSFVVKKDKDGNTQIIAQEVIRSAGGKVGGQISGDITSVVAPQDVATFGGFLTSLQALLEAQ